MNHFGNWNKCLLRCCKTILIYMGMFSYHKRLRNGKKKCLEERCSHIWLHKKYERKSNIIKIK